MPSKIVSTSTDPSTDPSAQLASVAALNGATMEIFTQACQAYAVGMATLNSEVVSFVNARVNQDVELGQALCRCGKWLDAMDLQQNWARQATQEYLGEASWLIDLASKVAKDNWDPIYERANLSLSNLGK